MEKEVWKDIKDYEGFYQVSNLGNVKRLSIKKLNGRYMSLCKEKLLKKGKDTDGYLHVILCENKNRKLFKVHQLVAIAFLNHVPNGQVLVPDHKNKIRDDNRLSNIQIVTGRENSNKKHLKSTSKYVGVHYNIKFNRWISQISINNKNNYLGCFKTEIEAHNAYQNKLKQI